MSTNESAFLSTLLAPLTRFAFRTNCIIQENKHESPLLYFIQVNSLAMDWLSDSLYMTDTLNGQITICNGHRVNVCKRLVTGLNQPFGIAVHPQQG